MENLVSAEEGPKFEVWAIGGGKGGTGKTALVAAIGFQLSRQGRRVLLVDADFGASNLHTCLGMAAPNRSLLDFLRSGGTVADEYATPTPYPNLRLLGGRVDEGTGEIPAGWGARLSSALRALPVDLVLVDLGAGAGPDTVEAMNLADFKVVVTTPESTAVENLASLLRSLCLQRLIQRLPSSEVRRRLQAIQGGQGGQGGARIRDVGDLFSEIEAVDPSLLGAARAIVEEMSLSLVMNQVRDDADRQFGAQTAAVIRRHFGLPMSYAGAVHHDDAVWRTLRRGKMFMVDASRSRAAEDVRRLARNLIRKADASPVF